MRTLTLAPHRLYFFTGTLAMLLLFGWWTVTLNRPDGLAAMPLHALLMPLGLFPLFILGFTFTAGPRWLGVNGEGGFLPIGAAYLLGLALAVAGAAVSSSALAAIGFTTMIFGWSTATWRWLRLVRRSGSTDKRHAWVLVGAMGGGLAALLATLAWLGGFEAGWMLARQLAFFGFLLPVFLTVCHRMLPFFTSSVVQPYKVWRPYGLLGGWLAASLGVGVTGFFGWHIAEAIIALAMAGSLAYTAWRWGLHRSLRNRLLAMLHLSFAWLPAAFALDAAGAAGVPVGSAALHALGLGFMGTMLVGFVSRVSFGHSGRPLQADTPLWTLYLALHAAALVRVLASLAADPLLVRVSAMAWLTLLLLWVARMAPIYLRLRVDGQPG